MLSTRNRSWRIPTSDRLVRWQKPKGLVYFSLSSEFQPSKIVVVVRIDWFSGFYFRVTELINLGPNPKYTLSGQQQLHFRSFLQGRCIYITHCRCSVPGYYFGFWNRVTGTLRRRPWALATCLQYLHGIECMHLSLFTIIKSSYITCRCFCVVRIFFGVPYSWWLFQISAQLVPSICADLCVLGSLKIQRCLIPVNILHAIISWQSNRLCAEYMAGARLESKNHSPPLGRLERDMTLLLQEKMHSLVLIFEADSRNSMQCRGRWHQGCTHYRSRDILDFRVEIIMTRIWKSKLFIYLITVVLKQ